MLVNGGLVSPLFPIVYLRLSVDNATMPIRIMILIFWIAGMLYPVNLLASNNAEVKTVFGQVADTEFSHVVAHLLLYGSFVLLAVLLLRLPFSLRTGLFLLGAVVLIGIGQEILQLEIKGRIFGGPELFDLQVDVAGGYLGWRLSYFVRWWGDQARRAFNFSKPA